MGRKPVGEPVYRFHPMLDAVLPLEDNFGHQTMHLRASLNTVGQVMPIIVTVDDFIIDGRKRFLISQKERTNPRVYKLPHIWSCVEQLPNGFSLEEELDTLKHCLEIIHAKVKAKATGRKKPQFVDCGWRPDWAS